MQRLPTALALGQPVPLAGLCGPSSQSSSQVCTHAELSGACMNPLHVMKGTGQARCMLRKQHLTWYLTHQQPCTQMPCSTHCSAVQSNCSEACKA